MYIYFTCSVGDAHCSGAAKRIKTFAYAIVTQHLKEIENMVRIRCNYAVLLKLGDVTVATPIKSYKK